MAADRHKHPKVSFRARGDDGEWLDEHASQIGQAANAILAGLLRAYRVSQEERPGGKDQPGRLAAAASSWAVDARFESMSAL